MTDPVVPAELRRRVLSDLKPVRPLWPPWKRGLVLLPLGLTLFVAVSVGFGLRHDAADLGIVRLWGLSALQVCLGGLVLLAAIRGAVPGRGPTGRAAAGLQAAGVVFVVAVTAVSWNASPLTTPAGYAHHYWEVCFRWTILLGTPVLAVAWGLATRGYPVRPAMVGALSGLGAGLMADAAWRTFCEVSQPSHVLSAHVAGVLVLVGLGTSMGRLSGWWASRHHRNREHLPVS